ncbi:MAG: HAD family hydrolase [Proteobacteria bacterium]|nr:HAD family hydrolase [Pseudomonadota bacterium]
MAIAGLFFDLGGTLFSYRNVARTNIPILIESVREMGVVADTDAIKKAYKVATKEVSHRYAEKSYYRHHDMFHEMYLRFYEILEADYDPDVHQRYHEIQQAALFACLEIKPDCIETLAALKAQGLYLSIVSNIDDDMLEPLVAREQLDRYLDHWTSSEAAQSCKPDRRFFDVALEKSGLEANQVLFVGDSPEHDIVGANNAGMRTVLITEHGLEPPLQTGKKAVDPDHTIQALAELIDLV